MNNILNAYVKAQRTTGSPRQIEAEALTVAANKLIVCQENWDSKERRELLEDALKFNQKLWTIFQVSVSNPNNLLPKKLRLNLLRLSAVVDRQIFGIMAKPEPEKLKTIIAINLSLAEGLRQTPLQTPIKNSTRRDIDFPG